MYVSVGFFRAVGGRGIVSGKEDFFVDNAWIVSYSYMEIIDGREPFLVLPQNKNVIILQERLL